MKNYKEKKHELAGKSLEKAKGGKKKERTMEEIFAAKNRAHGRSLSH